MSNLTNAGENALLDHILGNTPLTQPTLYVALLTAVSDAEAGTWTEVSGTNYARQTITFGAASGGTATNSADVEFPAAGSGGWGTITHIALYTASTGGTPYFWGQLSASKAVDEADIFTLVSGNVSISLD